MALDIGVLGFPPKLTLFGFLMFLGIMGHHGAFWDLMGSFGTFWDRLGPLGCFWDGLGRLGHFGTF